MSGSPEFPARARRLFRCARTLAFLAVVMAVACVSVARAADTCPQSAVRLRTTNYAFYTTPRLDTTSTQTGGDYRATYDLVAGTFGASRPIANFGQVEVIPADRYTLTGLAPGTPALIAVRLHVVGTVVSANICGGTGCGALLEARIVYGAIVRDTTIRVGFLGQTNLDGTLDLTLPVAAGTPFDLQFGMLISVGPGGDGYGGQGVASFTFANLPAGGSITSCQGFGQQPVPVHRTSWGRLKTVYR